MAEVKELDRIINDVFKPNSLQINDFKKELIRRKIICKDINEKKTRKVNPFLLYRSRQYAEAQTCILEMTPGITPQELRKQINTAIGQAWKQSTDEQRQKYKDEAERLTRERDEPAICLIESDDEEEDTGRTFSSDLNVWICGNLIFKNNSPDSPPIGTIKNGQIVKCGKVKK